MWDQENLEKYAGFVRDIAEQALADDGFLSPCIAAWKDGIPWVWVYPSGEGRDPILNAAVPMIIGMEPDMLTIVNDTFIVKGSPIEEDDGQKKLVKSDGSDWEQGDMGYAREHNTPDAQYVKDQIAVMTIDRTGTMSAVGMEYSLTDGKVEWGEQDVVVEGKDTGVFAGLIPDVLRRAFAAPTVRQQMQEMADLENDPIFDDVNWMAQFVMAGEPGMSGAQAMAYVAEFPDEAYAHMICAVIKGALAPQGCGVAIGVQSEEIMEVFRESLGGYGGTVFRPDEEGNLRPEEENND